MAKSSKTIDAYRKKRDFDRTPEPPPDAGSLRGTRAFVVHRHEARNLHYDLRLEMEGVLKSWAVPRGFSYDPKVKRLAVRTEDHPLMYETFEGVIPKGEYGGGTMTIWDRGRYELSKPVDGPRAVAEGKLEVTLRGRKLRGEWHLVKTRSEKDEWILFKARDRYAREESEKAPFFDLSRAVEAPLSEIFEPMRIGDERTPFSDPAWVFELEFEGRRAGLRKEGQSIRLLGKHGADLSDRAPEISKDALELRAENALVDGVLVAVDSAQRPSREKLEARLAGTSSDPLVFYAFDQLYYEEWDLRALPLLDRKEILQTLVPKLPRILYVDHVNGRGEEFHSVTAAAGLPAVIGKLGSSAYVSGPSSDWCRVPAEARSEPQARDLGDALRSRQKEGRKIQLSNLNKVFWPEEGYTKGDLLRYYDSVAGTLLPYLHERPVHMLRYPDGIEGKSFYQKDAPDHTPDWVITERIESDGEAIRYIICNDRDTLIWMVNLASIDLHPWFSRRTSRDNPDWVVFDLDAKKAPFGDVIKIARAVGKVLRGIGLRPYLKTSGATGLHVFVPVKPGYTYDQTGTFCEAIATHVASEHRDIATVERVVSRRGSRVYVDFGQNRKGQTVVPAYVVRPRPGAPVSTPLEWDELETDLDPVRFTIKTMPARLARLGDLFQGTLRDPQDLRPAIEAFQKNYIRG
ncbi:MAG TPA: non-homologous end-joining DNA ligase [Vicinamibacteria bacterium]|nr:non-homologous end-joining DNA ligase [Vicinamibacteria bacterium]